MRNDPLFIIIVLLCLLVVVVLARGLGHFAKGDADSGVKANKMMQLRIVAQAAAVLLIVIAIAIGG